MAQLDFVLTGIELQRARTARRAEFSRVIALAFVIIAGVLAVGPHDAGAETQFQNLVLGIWKMKGSVGAALVATLALGHWANFLKLQDRCIELENQANVIRTYILADPHTEFHHHLEVVGGTKLGRPTRERQMELQFEQPKTGRVLVQNIRRMVGRN